MKLIRKCALALLTVVLASSLVISCGGGDEPTPEPTPVTLSKVTFSPDNAYIAKGAFVTLKSKNKADIYYEVVKGTGAPTITEENYATVGTKYTKALQINEEETIYAFAVKDGTVSKIAKRSLKFPYLTPDSDLENLHDMILPAGTGFEIPAWGKKNPLVNDLPAVVTDFLKTGEDGRLTELNGKTNRTKALHDAMDAANAANSFDDLDVKNVIFVFTDGWGESCIVASREYYNNGVLTMDHLPYHAAVNHDSYQRPYNGSTEEAAVWKYDAENNDWNVSFYDETKYPVNKYETTDSTAGGSALNTGFTTYYSACAVDTHGTEVASLLELARQKGMLVGNVTNDYLTDATPATVGIHSPKRKDSNLINGRMFITSPDWTMGRGGFSSFISSADPFGSFASHEFSAPYDGMNKTHLEQWYKANTENKKLQKWAAAMLAEYDNKNVDPNSYDISKNWKKDRKLVQYGSFKLALQGLDSDVENRPYVPLGENPSNSYDYTADDFSKTKGNYNTAPSIGYKIGYGLAPADRGTFPNFAEMVASSLYALDKKAQDQNRGFFVFLENTSSDGWGHASQALDCLNETQITDEAIAIAAKYVLENPNTLLIVCADHETGDITYNEGWTTNYKKIKSNGSGHSGKPYPVYAFGASANKYFGDLPAFSTEGWTEAEKTAYAMGTIYPKPTEWVQEAEPTKQPASGDNYPKIIRNRQIGIRVAKTMGFDKFGDLDGNGLLDPVNESDSVVDIEGTKIASKKITRN